jgi:hypothetical protein
MENIEDKIIDMQHQLLLLQKEVEEQQKLEEDKQTVEYHLSQLKKIINEKKSREEIGMILLFSNHMKLEESL